ncbi:unnamed protein product [Owenia fusiformis]|uniref:Uncharacterized protein n=1 Tax=Owenia fusiformis TaxID=6347 RepID=A0A8J1TR06_OWEFU|nr:unnamed protein product [Owenia fusiformis]
MFSSSRYNNTMDWKSKQYLQQKTRKNKTSSTVRKSKVQVVHVNVNGDADVRTKSGEMASHPRPHTTGGAVINSTSRIKENYQNDNGHRTQIINAKQNEQQRKTFDSKQRGLRINNYVCDDGNNVDTGGHNTATRSGIKRPHAAKTKINIFNNDNQTHGRCSTTLPIITHDAPSPRSASTGNTRRDMSPSTHTRNNTHKSRTLDIQSKLSGSRQSFSQGSDSGTISSRRGSISSLTSSRSAPEYLYGATQWDMFSESLKHLNDDSNLYMKKPKVSFDSSVHFKDALISWKKHTATSRRGKGWRAIAKGGKSWAALSVQFKKNEVREENSDSDSEHEPTPARTTESQRRWGMIRRNIQDIQLERRANKAVFNWDMLRQHLMNLSDMEKGRRDLYERYLVLKDPMANSKTPQRDLKSALVRVKTWNEKEVELLKDKGKPIGGAENKVFKIPFSQNRHGRSFSK